MRLPLTMVALAAALSACGGPSSQSGASATAAAQSVKVSTVESQKLQSTLTLPAQALPFEVVDVYPKVTGFLDEIRVDRGSRVRMGELLARLTAPELVAQRAQAESAVQSAEAQLTAAQAKLAADEGTYAHLAAAAKTPGVVAGNDLLIAEKAAAADKAQVDAASKNEQATRDALRAVAQLESYLEIRAPFDAVVTSRNLHPGALVGPASAQSGAKPIVQIETLNRLRVVVPVPEAYVAGLQQGQPVNFRVPAIPGKTFEAPIARISHDINQNTRTMQVELDYHNESGEITPGTFAQVDWPIARPAPSLVVPSSAITTDLQRTFVIRVRDGKAEWVDVTAGWTLNGKTEVFGALQAGDQVVTNATDAIRAGTPLSPQSK